MTVPHREFLDLSIVYEILLVEERGMQGKIRIDNEYMEHLGITEQELYVDANANMEKSLLIKMDNMLCESLGEEIYMELPKVPVSMYVLCNKSRMYGAIGMTDKKAMQKAAEIFGGNFIILPSSVHDLILIPDVEKPEEAERLAKMVQEINETQVLAEEVLSGHVYRYHH